MARATAERLTQEGATAARVEGLCGTCRHEAGCALRAVSGNVLFCEEFETVPGEPRAVFPAPAQGAAVAPDTPAGLCVNCLRRADCALSRVEGGVWYCEEYA